MLSGHELEKCREYINRGLVYEVFRGYITCPICETQLFDSPTNLAMSNLLIHNIHNHSERVTIAVENSDTSISRELLSKIMHPIIKNEIIN